MTELAEANAALELARKEAERLNCETAKTQEALQMSQTEAATLRGRLSGVEEQLAASTAALSAKTEEAEKLDQSDGTQGAEDLDTAGAPLCISLPCRCGFQHWDHVEERRYD